MAIKQLLELIGDDIVISKLDAVQKKGEATLATFNKPLPELKFNAPDSKSITQFTDQTIKLKDALHALRPILQAAGVQFSEFGGLVRLASTSLIGLGAATVGAVVVGLAKLEENAARTRGTLSDLFRSNERGDQAFAALNRGAQEFGTTVDKLAPGLQAFQTALNNVDKTAQGFVALKAEDLPGGGPRNVALVTEAYNNFIKILRAGRLTQDDAEKSARAFFETMKAGGPLTRAALENLPVGTVTLLQQALGAAGLSTQAFFKEVDAGAVTVDKLKSALANFGPESERAFQIKGIKTFSDEIGKLLTTVGEGFKGLTGKAFSEFVIGEISRVRQGVEDSIDEFNRVLALIKSIEKATEIPGIGELVTKLRGAPGAGITTGPTLAQAGLAGTAFLPTPEMAGNAGEEAAAAFREGFLKKGFLFPPTGEAGKGVGGFVFPPEVAQQAGEDFVGSVRKAIETSDIVPTEAQQNLVEQFKESGTQAGTNFGTGLNTSMPQNLSLFQDLWNRAAAIFATPIPVAFTGFGGQSSGAPFASGGFVRGPGTTTSDSILAFLSNREFVVNARAVSHYGADLFAALNAMRLPQDFISKFSMGGLARAMSGNRFAGGGQVSSGTPVILNIDRQSFNMTAGSDTVAALKRYSVAAQLSSTGRKPSWVK